MSFSGTEFYRANEELAVARVTAAVCWVLWNGWELVQSDFGVMALGGAWVAFPRREGNPNCCCAMGALLVREQPEAAPTAACSDTAIRALGVSPSWAWGFMGAFDGRTLQSVVEGEEVHGVVELGEISRGHAAGAEVRACFAAELPAARSAT